MDIINDVETSILHHREASDLRDSDYESDPDPIRIPPNMGSTHLLLPSLIVRYRKTLRLRYPADRSIIHAPEKQLERSTDLSKNTALSARTRGHRSVVRTVSDWRLGSFRVKYLNHESMNIFQVALVILPRSAIALCIR